MFVRICKIGGKFSLRAYTVDDGDDVWYMTECDQVNTKQGASFVKVFLWM